MTDFPEDPLNPNVFFQDLATPFQSSYISRGQSQQPIRNYVSPKLSLAGVGQYDVAAGRSDILESRLPPSEAIRADGSVDYSHPEHLRSGALWAYIVIVVIVALIAFTLIWNSNIDGWYDSLDRPGTLSIEWLLFIWFIAFILVIIVAYVGHVEAPNSNIRMLLTWAFLLQLLLLAIWTLVFYQEMNLLAGFYLAIITFFIAVWWMVLAWQINTFIGFLLLIYVIWLGYLVWSQWQILNRNED